VNKGVPSSRQNRASGGFALPHVGHTISILLSSRAPSSGHCNVPTGHRRPQTGQIRTKRFLCGSERAIFGDLNP